jgi:hypothetical protein
MIAIADFWKQQSFHHLITYSFNRGPKLAALQTAADQVLVELAATPPTDYLRQFKLKRQLREVQAEAELGAYRRRILNAQGKFDNTAEQIAVVEQNSDAARQLRHMFQRVKGEVMYAMCMPVFRDALVFYDEHGRLVQALNICFECLYIEASDGLVVEADVAVYRELHKRLAQLGHPIELPGW